MDARYIGIGRYNVSGLTSLAPRLDSSQVPAKLPRKYVRNVRSWSIVDRRKGTIDALLLAAHRIRLLFSICRIRDTCSKSAVWKRVMCHEKRAYVLIFARNYIFKVAFLLNSANVCASSGCKAMTNDRIGFISSNLKLIGEWTRVES